MMIADWCKQNGVPPPTPRAPGPAFTSPIMEGAGTGSDAGTVAGESACTGMPSSASEGGSGGRQVVQRSRQAAERANRATDRALESERRQRALRDPMAWEASKGGGQVVFVGAAGGGSGSVSRPQLLPRAPKISAFHRSESEDPGDEAQENEQGARAQDRCSTVGGEEGEGVPRWAEGSEAALGSPSPVGSSRGSFKGDPLAMSGESLDWVCLRQPFSSSPHG